MLKYCSNISRLGFFILYIMSPLSHFISSIRFISFFLVFLLHTRCPISIPSPLSFIFLFLPHSRTLQQLSFSLFFLQLSLSLSLSLSLFTWFQNIHPQRNPDGSSSSQSSWPNLKSSLIFVPNVVQMGQMASVFCLFFFSFFVMIWLILKLCFWVCILII